jgi:hypothetical protein
MSIQLKAANGAICTLSLSFNNDGPLGTFFRYIGDTAPTSRATTTCSTARTRRSTSPRSRVDERHRAAGPGIFRRDPGRRANAVNAGCRASVALLQGAATGSSNSSCERGRSGARRRRSRDGRLSRIRGFLQSDPARGEHRGRGNRLAGGRATEERGETMRRSQLIAAGGGHGLRWPSDDAGSLARAQTSGPKSPWRWTARQRGRRSSGCGPTTATTRPTTRRPRSDRTCSGLSRPSTTRRSTSGPTFS